MVRVGVVKDSFFSRLSCLFSFSLSLIQAEILSQRTVKLKPTNQPIPKYVSGRPTNVAIVGQGYIMLAVGTSGVIWTLFLSLFLSLSYLFVLPASWKWPDIN